jgi:hypothetical protein
MLASASAIWQVSTIVLVGHRHWSSLSTYERLRTVEAASCYVKEMQEAYERRQAAIPVSTADELPLAGRPSSLALLAEG